MNPDPNPNPNPNRNNPNNLLDTINLIRYNVRIGCCGLSSNRGRHRPMERQKYDISYMCMHPVCNMCILSLGFSNGFAFIVRRIESSAQLQTRMFQQVSCKLVACHHANIRMRAHRLLHLDNDIQVANTLYAR